MDLFENYKKQPKSLQKICEKYAQIEIKEGFDYKKCESFLKEVKKIGFIFDYGLDAQPYDLRPIKN